LGANVALQDPDPYSQYGSVQEIQTDPDPDPGCHINTDPLGSGSETLARSEFTFKIENTVPCDKIASQ